MCTTVRQQALIPQTLGDSPLKASSTKAEADCASLAASQSPQPWEIWKLQGEGSCCCILHEDSQDVHVDLSGLSCSRPGHPAAGWNQTWRPAEHRGSGGFRETSVLMGGKSAGTSLGSWVRAVNDSVPPTAPLTPSSHRLRLNISVKFFCFSTSSA